MWLCYAMIGSRYVPRPFEDSLTEKEKKLFELRQHVNHGLKYVDKTD